MAVSKVVRYTTTPETADDNERLVRGVFAELATQHPDGLRYTVYRLADGVSFLHVATIEGADNPLVALGAFGEFQSGIAERCVDGPTPADATMIGSYGPP